MGTVTAGIMCQKSRNELYSAAKEAKGYGLQPWMEIDVHSREESAAINVCLLADAMTAVVLDTSSSGRKGQWRAGLEEITAPTGLKHVGQKPPLQDISFQLHPGRLLSPSGNRSLQ